MIMELGKDRFKITAFWTLCIFYWEVAVAGKTATRVGLAGIATVAGGSSGGYAGLESGGSSVNHEQDLNGSTNFINDLHQLKYDLFTERRYDRTMRPVLNHSTITPVFLDFTMRQVLDLDEKNQVLKTYVWMRTFWYDEFLTWNKSQYGEITKLWVPASSVWRPDIVVYEDTGGKDYNPRLPYATITDTGRVSMAEPTAYETSCSIDIAFFPFDYQGCSLTFTSWTFPSDQVDVIARKTGKQMEKDIEMYFMKTGEWKITRVNITKTSENFGTIVQGGNSNQKTISNDFPDTSHIWRMQIKETMKVQDVAPDRLTDVHWTDIKYTFLLRRNSSLYMQSMLFPAILLTTVALLGFYLPPDSGERIGLQITILLTFMVFLLTVGEMFPASTGPFLGVYYVLCMALLGINLFMTVLVLHLHYMPTAAVMGANKDGKMTSKPVPKWIRLLLYVGRFTVHRQDDDHSSPTSKIVQNIIKTGYLSAASAHGKEKINKELQKKESKDKLPKSTDQKSKNKQNGKQKSKKIINTGRTSIPGAAVEKKTSPSTSIHLEDASDKVAEENTSGIVSFNNTIYDNAVSNMLDSAQDSMSGDGTEEHPFELDESLSLADVNEQDGQCSQTELKTLENILGKAREITSYLKSQNTQLLENNASAEVEDEWKAMARVVDQLCMKFYLALLIISHASILTAALVKGSTNNLMD